MSRCGDEPCFMNPQRLMQGKTKDALSRTQAQNALVAGSQMLGVTLDLGIPDGVMSGLALRPCRFARFGVAAGTNGISAGLRAGVSVRLPTFVTPSFHIEGGHYFDGNANSIASKFASSDYRTSPLAESVGYQFANLHGGIEIGGNDFAFFVHGGMSFIHAKLHGVNDAIGNVASDSATVVTINGDPRLTAWIPSAKLGFVLYLV